MKYICYFAVKFNVPNLSVEILLTKVANFLQTN